MPSEFLARAWIARVPVPADTVNVPVAVLKPAPAESAAPNVAALALTAAAPKATMSTAVVTFGTTPENETTWPLRTAVWLPGYAPIVKVEISGPAAARFTTTEVVEPVSEVMVTVVVPEIVTSAVPVNVRLS
ncbi:hypothetical protein D3C75_685040 [compost metagenome]